MLYKSTVGFFFLDRFLIKEGSFLVSIMKNFFRFPRPGIKITQSLNLDPKVVLFKLKSTSV